MSEAAAEAPEPEDAADAEKAFLKRQADAQFEVAGPAPAWALKWPGDNRKQPAS